MFCQAVKSATDTIFGQIYPRLAELKAVITEIYI